MNIKPSPVKAMDVTITGMTLNMTGGPASGGSPEIDNYFGYAFYYHVSPSVNEAGVDIVIDQNAPSSYQGTGTVNSVNIYYSYQAGPSTTQQQMTFDNPGVTYGGNPLNLSLQFTEGMTQATFMISEQNTAMLVRSSGNGDTASLQIYVVDAAYSVSGNTEGYFINVPFNDNYQDCTTATLDWPDKGGLAGPVGGANSP